MVVDHVAGWPIAAWLFLPYVALVNDHLGPTVARWMVIAWCAVQDGVALYDGVPWMMPLAFTALAVFCSTSSHVRFSLIRDMLISADEQRRTLEKEIEGRKHAEVELRQAQKLEAVELGNIPPVKCHIGQIQQVLLNLIINAAHAVADAGGKGTITIRTTRESGSVLLSIADDGPGIPLDVQPKIFDPFFTTKEIGRGTGQGLAFAEAARGEREAARAA